MKVLVIRARLVGCSGSDLREMINSHVVSSIAGLSVIVITRNEERDVAGCLDSVREIAEEIVVVDSGSTDRTLEICRSYTARIYSNGWPGYGPQKQFALERAAGPWVLNIDADERLSDELREEIRSMLASASAAALNGFEIPFRQFFLGRWLRFGGLRGETHVRLFRKEKARYGGKKIHEGISVEPPIGRLTGAIDHFSYRTIADYLEKCNRYTSLIADEKFQKGQRFAVWHHARLPYEFFVRFVVKLGFLDGWAGFTYATLSSYYVWLKYLKLRDLEAARHG